MGCAHWPGPWPTETATPRIKPPRGPWGRSLLHHPVTPHTPPRNSRIFRAVALPWHAAVPTWQNHIKTHGERAEVEELATWLRSLGEHAEVSVAGPDRFGVYDVKVSGPIDVADDAEAAISRWDQEHPGLIVPPEDWLPDD
jgi:hypothetical protein